MISFAFSFIYNPKKWGFEIKLQKPSRRLIPLIDARVVCLRFELVRR